MKSRDRQCRNIFLLSVVSLGLQALPAQPPALQPNILFTAGASYTTGNGQNAPKFPLADLLFNLRKSEGTPILVHPEELALFSEGREIGTCTGIRTFDRTGYGTSTVIALDASGALHALTPNAVNLAVFTVVHDGVRQDTTAVTTLAEDFQVDLPFHPGPRKWKANVALFPERGKSTHLYDGLLKATALFTPALPRRRVLLIIADGRDGGSEHTPLDLLARAKSLGIEIDTIALASQTTDVLITLQQVSLASGGTYTLAHDGDELQQMIALHLSAIRATPVAEFKLSHLSPDGEVAALQLRWLTGNLSTPAFISMPQISSPLPFPISAFAHSPLSNPWLLGFGSCFVLGIGLLIVSLFLPHATQAPTAPNDSAPPRARGVPTGSPMDVKRPAGLPGTHKLLKQPSYIENESERQKLEFSRRFEAPPEGPYARVIIRNNALAGRILPMAKATFSIGALPTNDLALPGDVTISGNHLRLIWENGILFVEDALSTNGTYLNRLRLPEGRHALKPGDEIGLGQTFLIVEQS